MNHPGIGELLGGVGKIADDLFVSDEERFKIVSRETAIGADLLNTQIDIDKAEAQHPSLFVAGWRPFIGWVGGIALAYQFLLYPLLTWIWAFMQAKGWIPAAQNPPPVLKAEELWVVLTGMLGIAGLRSFDKLKGIDTTGIGK